jgi:hypothetical protein
MKRKGGKQVKDITYGKLQYIGHDDGDDAALPLAK